MTHENIIKGFMIFITITFLFPPFESVHPYGGAGNAGYAFILFPPERGLGDGKSIVNTDMLLIEWGFAFMLATAAWFLIKVRDKNS